MVSLVETLETRLSPKQNLLACISLYSVAICREGKPSLHLLQSTKLRGKRIVPHLFEEKKIRFETVSWTNELYHV